MFLKLTQIIIALASSLAFSSTSLITAFAPQHRLSDNPIQFNVNTLHTSTTTTTVIGTNNSGPRTPTELIIYRQQRKSMASVQTMSLFGLGGPELVVIGIAFLFFLGPQKLAEIARGAGAAATDFKDVPKEFQKGLEEGEIESRSRKAKQMDDPTESSDSK